MKLSKILHSLTEKDPKIVEIPDFVISGKPSDENHAQRRMQQRAINEDMLIIPKTLKSYAIAETPRKSC
ncbi:hypothetical protein [Cyanobacterium sp. Dongsha4]|uniref:hypothetical protein n=1 Tax=Cyanobacterium sp. DS4 TaxID=2878255 RepID=UPI002E80EF7E|nr:hypothetical protein [Cyanobacterium sp. Dongsha4]WVK99138.1 hypothetical protein Dongsha4_10555 [Cyanobacterium sp. Dongsha4]